DRHSAAGAVDAEVEHFGLESRAFARFALDPRRWKPRQLHLDGAVAVATFARALGTVERERGRRRARRLREGGANAVEDLRVRQGIRARVLADGRLVDHARAQRRVFERLTPAR